MAKAKNPAMTEDQYRLPEELTIVKPCRVLEDGAKKIKVVKKGDSVTVSGLDKVQLLASEKALYPADYKKLYSGKKAD